ncbi:hypothetical protein SDJN02_00384, partial [Cucurbita argyrosperma subsp. argyrosperma]
MGQNIWICSPLKAGADDVHADRLNPSCTQMANDNAPTTIELKRTFVKDLFFKSNYCQGCSSSICFDENHIPFPPDIRISFVFRNKV